MYCRETVSTQLYLGVVHVNYMYEGFMGPALVLITVVLQRRYSISVGLGVADISQPTF